MYRDHAVGVVVPAYDEAEHVGRVIDRIPAFVDRVYAVDDCSTDDTWEVILSRAADDGDAEPESAGASEPPTPVPDGGRGAGPTVVPIRHDENMGAGGALKTGYRRALRDGMDVTVTLDADDQMDPGLMDRLLDPIVEGAAGFTKGNRLADGTTGAEMPTVRYVGNWVLTLLTKVASGYWGIRDPQNGYTAISHDALAAIDLDAVPDDHDYPNDLLARLNVAGVRVVDVPMPARYGDEESTIDFWSFVPRTSATLCRVFLWRLGRTYAGRGGTAGVSRE